MPSMYGALLRPLVRYICQQAADYVSPPSEPAADYVSPPLRRVDLEQMARISELALRTGDVELLVSVVNMDRAYLNSDPSRVRMELFDAAKRVRAMYPERFSRSAG